MARTALKTPARLWKPENVGDHFVGFFQDTVVLQHGPCMRFVPGDEFPGYEPDESVFVPVSSVLKDVLPKIEAGDLVQFVFRGTRRAANGQSYKNIRVYRLDDMTDAVDPNDTDFFAAEEAAERKATGKLPDDEDVAAKAEPTPFPAPVRKRHSAPPRRLTEETPES